MVQSDSVHKMRMGNGENLGIILHITFTNICCDPSLEPSHREGSDEGSHHMFSLRNKKKSQNNP